MSARNAAEFVAMVTVGDGAVGLVAPRRRSLLRRFGPEGYGRAMEAFARRPALGYGSWPRRR